MITGRYGDMEQISIHALREEGDMLCRSANSATLNFYPRPPRGGRLQSVPFSAAICLFLSTPSARRATTNSAFPLLTATISIHALREEGDPSFFDRRYHNGRFLSTPSARRATGVVGAEVVDAIHFYPRPPRGGRRFGGDFEPRAGRFLSTPSARRATSRAARLRARNPEISIHALREEGDNTVVSLGDINADFYPRPPRGGRRE